MDASVSILENIFSEVSAKRNNFKLLITSNNIKLSKMSVKLFCNLNFLLKFAKIMS